MRMAATPSVRHQFPVMEVLSPALELTTARFMSMHGTRITPHTLNFGNISSQAAHRTGEPPLRYRSTGRQLPAARFSLRHPDLKDTSRHLKQMAAGLHYGY